VAWKVLTFTFALGIVAVLLFTFARKKAREPLPALAAELARVKSLCEQHAAAVKGLRAAGQLDGVALIEGEDLYVSAKAEHDGCVTFLRTALDAGFTERHATEGAALLDRARTKGEAFLEWARKAENWQGADKGLWPTQNPIDLVGLVRWAGDADQGEVQSLKGELERCRFRPWAEIGAGPAVPTGP
jgi:hypothetical protein